MNVDLVAIHVTADLDLLDTCTRNEPSNFADCHFDSDGNSTRVLGYVTQNGSEAGLFQLMISAY